MDRSRDNETTTLTRRAAVGRMGAVMAGLVAAACTPLRIVLKDYPEEFSGDAELVDRTLRAFVRTIVPGGDADDPDLARVYAASFHPFAPHRGFFASDLCQRALRRTGRERFDQLTLDERVAVVEDGLRADAITRRLYTGAILLAQIAVYGGIFDDTRGSPLIGFEGRHRFRGFDRITYPDPERFLAMPLTATGNPA